MQVVTRSKVLSKGRWDGDLLLKQRAALFAVMGLSILLLALLLIKGRVEVEKSPVTAESRIANGQSVVIPTFQSERGYITYRVTGSGSRFFYGSVAKRFHVCGGWHKIAELTLKHQAIKPDQKAIEAAQYKIETGMEMIIPLAICNQDF